MKLLLAPFQGTRQIAIAILSILGLGESCYLTALHYAGVAPVCPTGVKIFNCGAVVTSPESVLFGIPVPIYGLLFFTGMFLLARPQAWGALSNFAIKFRFGSVVVGVCFVIYLLQAELFEVHEICLWCSGVHLITFVIFALVVTEHSDDIDAESAPEELEATPRHSSQV